MHLKLEPLTIPTKGSQCLIRSKKCRSSSPKDSLEDVYPALITANGARAEGIEANLFFTFFGHDVVHRSPTDHIKVATVGNPGLHLATMAGRLPGVSSVITHYLEKKMEKLDIPPFPRSSR